MVIIISIITIAIIIIIKCTIVYYCNLSKSMRDQIYHK